MPAGNEDPSTWVPLPNVTGAGGGTGHVVNDATPAPKTPEPTSRVTVAGVSTATTAAVAVGKQVEVANSSGCPAVPATGPPVSPSANPAPDVMKTLVAPGNTEAAIAAAVAYRSGPEILATVELYVLSWLAIAADTALVPPRIVIEDGASADSAVAVTEGSVVGLVNRIAACWTAAAAVPASASGKAVPAATNTGLPVGNEAATLAAVAYRSAPETRVTGPDVYVYKLVFTASLTAAVPPSTMIDAGVSLVSSAAI